MPSQQELPTGHQHVLRDGTSEVVVTEVGGGIRSFTVGDIPVLDGFAADQGYDGGRGQTLLPWPNRVADGRYTWAGEEHQLALSEPARGNAIHGLTRWVNWELVASTPASAHLRYLLHAQSGWPFLLRCELRYDLAGPDLTVRTTVTNVGGQPCPVAAGAHPYLSAGGGLVDDCTLVLPAASSLPTDERGIPTGEVPVEGTAQDLRVTRRLGEQQLDVAYGRLSPGPDGRTTVRLDRPDGRAVELWAGPGYDYLQVFTGDTLTPERRRRGVAVEPMTAPANALRSGVGLTSLEPGEQLDLSWGVGLR
jgi:aldose 1-epimerase